MAPVSNCSLVLDIDDGHKSLLMPVVSVEGFSLFDTSGEPKKKSVNVLFSPFFLPSGAFPALGGWQ